jgi:Fe-S cluster assembly iron-binding protein IscA
LRKLKEYVMITVTERAKEELESMLTSKVDNSQAALRLIATHEGEYGLHVDIENPGDKVVKYKGRKLLVIDGKLADNLEGTTLDAEITPEGIELALFQNDQQ